MIRDDWSARISEMVDLDARADAAPLGLIPSDLPKARHFLDLSKTQLKVLIRAIKRAIRLVSPHGLLGASPDRLDQSQRIFSPRGHFAGQREEQAFVGDRPYLRVSLQFEYCCDRLCDFVHSAPLSQPDLTLEPWARNPKGRR